MSRPLVVATDGYLGCPDSPPLAIATDGYLCLIRLVFADGGGGASASPRKGAEILYLAVLAVLLIEDEHG